jgi:serine/threonine-protein kinase
MGAVFLARNVRTNGPAAVKILHREGTANPVAVARFRREAQLVAAIGDERFCQVYDFGEWHGRPYIVMQLLRGRTFTDWLGESSATPAGAVRILVEVCLAMQAAHERGVVHRDLKPDNIWVQLDGRVMVLDLGIAKIASDGKFKTRTGSVLGTPPLMSPEQCLDSASVDHRSDIYTVAVILFRALSGRYPFDSDRGMGEILTMQIRDEPPRLQSWAPATPDGLATVVHRNLEKDPARRMQSMRELADALQPYARAAFPAAPTVRMLPQPISASLNGEMTARPVRGRTPLVVGLALAAALCCAGVLLLLLRRPPAPVVAAAEKPVTPEPIAPVVVEPKSTPLPPKEPARPTAPARLIVSVTPWANVFVDGVKKDTAPCSLRLPAGAHHVRLVNDGLGKREDVRITVGAGETRKIERAWVAKAP